MVMDKPAKALCDAQMNYEFVPIDALIHQALSLIHIYVFIRV